MLSVPKSLGIKAKGFFICHFTAISVIIIIIIIFFYFIFNFRNEWHLWFSYELDYCLSLCKIVLYV